MSLQKTDIKPYEIKDLLSDGSSYVIPIYQRSYAWTAKEIEQLIRDVMDYAKTYPGSRYYIGTLVVYPENNHYSTIDGQQRLTTLMILCTALKNHFPEANMSWFTKTNLHFECRTKSEKTLEALFHGKLNEENLESNLLVAYKICIQEVKKQAKAYKINITDFAKYLFKYVTLLRVPLPSGIDLNHYFEIMNSRGEQLEKHEILKAKLMGIFNEMEDRDDKIHLYKHVFNLVWEACSNMERYVQMEFAPDIRHRIFGQNNWNTFTVNSFDDLVESIKHPGNETELIRYSVDQILNNVVKDTIQETQKSEDAPDRFTTVINFPNFLLHVLRLQTESGEVSLDDKQLIDIFYQSLPKNSAQRIEFVKQFGYNLLRAKFLFDKYIIKRDETIDKWSLLKLEHYAHQKSKNGVKYLNSFGADDSDETESITKRVIMLLSMFHVSHASQSYKYWLNAAMYYLWNQYDIAGEDYAEWLEHIAKLFVFDNYLATKPRGYYGMIYENKEPIKRNLKSLDLEYLRYPYCENLIFNFLDYLLWREYKNKINDKRVTNYEFTFRSSVEHYYPQNPENIDKLADNSLHSFGNLCLISHDKNSRLSNLTPKAKNDYYGKSKSIDSIKQYFMMIYSGEWNEVAIKKHDAKMIELLIKNIHSNYSFYKESSQALRLFREYQTRDRNLLVRALLSFDDCTIHTGGNRYQLFDFEYIRNHQAVQMFENYLDEHDIKTLDELIKKRLQLQGLKNSWRYLFVKHKELIEYCQGGKIDWYEESNGKLIYLLNADKNTKYSAVEMFAYLLKVWLNKEYDVIVDIDNEYARVNIKLDDQGYGFTDYNNAEVGELLFWNQDGISINYELNARVNANSHKIKNLVENYSWQRQEQGIYIRNNKQRLFTLSDDFEENEEMLYQSIYQLFKNGLGIKLGSKKR